MRSSDITFSDGNQTQNPINAVVCALSAVPFKLIQGFVLLKRTES